MQLLQPDSRLATAAMNHTNRSTTFARRPCSRASMHSAALLARGGGDDHAPHPAPPLALLL